MPSGSQFQPLTRIDLRPWASLLANHPGDVYIGFIGPSGKVAVTDGNPATVNRSFVWNRSVWTTDGSVNSIDALSIARRFVGLITGFPSGDWVFENKAISIGTTGNYNQDILGLCYGDINGSYNPTAKK